MREPELATRIRDRDLPVVHMAGEHELESPGLEAVQDSREVVEQDPEVSVVRERVRVGLRPAPQHALRVCARDPDEVTTHLYELAFVEQKSRRLERT
jgi:translation initiation factor 2 alpha subunit (eIF-2alpha)